MGFIFSRSTKPLVFLFSMVGMAGLGWMVLDRTGGLVTNRPSSMVNQTSADVGTGLELLPSRIDEFTTAEALSESGLFARVVFSGTEPSALEETIEAFVETSTDRLRMQPNPVGEFPGIFVAEPEIIKIRLVYPEAAAGDEVAIAAIDGGEFVGTGEQEIRHVAPDGLISLDFKPGITPGRHRLLLQHSGKSQAIDVWVGPTKASRQLASD